MRHFSGRGGELFLASEATPFQAMLEDVGDGFDWRAGDSALRHWLDEEPVRFEVLEAGEWSELEPVEVVHASGRVGFGRCLRGMSVRASGVCLPLTRIGEAAAWELEVEAAVKDISSLGTGPASEVVLGKTAAQLSGCLLESLYRPFLAASRVLAVLPMALGAFVGIGTLSERAAGVVFVSFNEKGVTHGSV